MDVIRDKIGEANSMTDSLTASKLAARKTHEMHLMRAEDIQRHKQSLLHQTSSVKKLLKEKVKQLDKMRKCDDKHMKTAERIEAKGEVHDSRILVLEQRSNEVRGKFTEMHAHLEDGRRKVRVLRREITNVKERHEAQEVKIRDMQKIIKKSDRIFHGKGFKREDLLSKRYELEDMIDQMREKIKVNEERIHLAERTMPSLAFKIDLVKKEIKDTKSKSRKVKNDIQSSLKEVHTFVSGIHK